MRMLLGLLAPSEGSARVLGREIPRDAEALRPAVGYMTQRFSLYDDLDVRENLEFAAEIFGLSRARRRARIAAAIDRYELGGYARTRAAALSGGWKQRLALAVATIHEPELLVLDEPTAGVDPQSRRAFWAQLFELAAQGTTVFVSTHYMDEAVRCHRLCILRDGQRVALGAPGGPGAAPRGASPRGRRRTRRGAPGGPRRGAPSSRARPSSAIPSTCCCAPARPRRRRRRRSSSASSPGGSCRTRGCGPALRGSRTSSWRSCSASGEEEAAP